MRVFVQEHVERAIEAALLHRFGEQEDVSAAHPDDVVRPQPLEQSVLPERPAQVELVRKESEAAHVVELSAEDIAP
jgi:hypothetical protein